MKKLIVLVQCAVLTVSFVGCTTASESPYRDPGEMRGRTTDFTTYDVQQCATALIDSLLANHNLDARIKRQFGDKTPLVAIRLENLTYQLSATDKLKKSMFNTIESRLLDSGRFEFVDRSAEKLIVDDTIREMDGAIVKDGAAAGLKDSAGVDYILAGELEEFREGDGRIHDTYYKMTVKLYNKHTKRIDWSGAKELRKVSTRPVVGW
jgi:PBP1b-binding outer membrane lipoprotein LpoB